MRHVWVLVVVAISFLLPKQIYAGVNPIIKVHLQQNGQNLTASTVIMKDQGLSLCENGACDIPAQLLSPAYTITLYDTNHEIPTWGEWRKLKLMAKDYCHEFVKEKDNLTKAESSWFQTPWFKDYDSKFGRGTLFNSIYQLFVDSLGFYTKAYNQHFVDQGLSFYSRVDQCPEYGYDYAQNKYQGYLKNQIRGTNDQIVQIPKGSIVTDKEYNRHVNVELH